MVIFSISFLCWFTFPLYYGGLEISLTLIFILCCLSFGVYPILGAGWASNSKYAIIGGLRAVAQTVSYEVRFAIIILSLILFNRSFSFKTYILNPQLNGIIILPLLVIWFTSILAETNRTPFDFSEGESELVSGFNTEYSAGGFTLFFLAEYRRILFIRFLTSILFFISQNTLVLSLEIISVASAFIWVRGTLPRLRYDLLIILAWKLFLPLALSYLLLSLGVIFLF